MKNQLDRRSWVFNLQTFIRTFYPKRYFKLKYQGLSFWMRLLWWIYYTLYYTIITELFLLKLPASYIKIFNYRHFIDLLLWKCFKRLIILSLLFSIRILSKKLNFYFYFSRKTSIVDVWWRLTAGEFVLADRNLWIQLRGHLLL